MKVKKTNNNKVRIIEMNSSYNQNYIKYYHKFRLLNNKFFIKLSNSFVDVISYDNLVINLFKTINHTRYSLVNFHSV